MILISIGYQDFLLPDDKGALQILRVLAKAIPVSNRWSMASKRSLEIQGDHVDCEIFAVPPGTKIVHPSGADTTVAEVIDRKRFPKKPTRALTVKAQEQPRLFFKE